MKCKICGIRKPRRFCPGVSGDICSLCCGTEREVTVNCPLDCEFLQEAHIHERPLPVTPEDMPNADIRVTEEFLESRQQLLFIFSSILLQSALTTRGLVDSDVREALAALTQTYRTLQSGLYYESKSTNPLAAAVQEKVQEKLADLKTRLAENNATIRDSEILGLLVFLQRLEVQWNNGRPKGRAFLDWLRRMVGAPAVLDAENAAEPSGSLIIP